jgi:hypothetical protein
MHFAPTLGLQALSQSQGLPRILSHPVRVELRSQREQWGARADKRMHWMGCQALETDKTRRTRFWDIWGLVKEAGMHTFLSLLVSRSSCVRFSDLRKLSCVLYKALALCIWAGIVGDRKRFW